MTERRGDKKLADNMWRMLGERDWSQSKLASETELSISTMNNTMNTRHGVTLRTLRKIRAALGCTWDELLE